MEHSQGTLKELLNFNLTNNKSMADKTDVLKNIYILIGLDLDQLGEHSQRQKQKTRQ